MPPLPFDLQDATLGDGMSLVVVERNGHNFNDSEVKLAGDAASYLEKAWAQTLETLQDCDLIDYSPEVIIRSDEDRALVINDDLREEHEVIDMLLDDVDRQQQAPDNLSSDDLYLYAVISDTDAGRVAMIKKKSPTKRARGGKKLFLARNELEGLEADPWELYPTFDLVVNENGGYALNTFLFDQLFADADRLRAKIGPWVNDIAHQLPMAPNHRDFFVAACDERPRLRRRLRSIAHRGHIGRVSINDVQRHLRQMHLPVHNFVRRGRLVVDEHNIEELLRILNEDLTRGGLTSDPFWIESKEPMGGRKP